MLKEINLGNTNNLPVITSEKVTSKLSEDNYCHVKKKIVKIKKNLLNVNLKPIS